MNSIKPTVSSKNTYYISKHRYYELKHFCLQYGEWKKQRDKLYFYTSSVTKRRCNELINDYSLDDVVFDRLYFADRIDMINQIAKETNETLAPYILKAVTENYSYHGLNSIMYMPCGRDVYYRYYRKFFWLLDKKRK